MKLKIRFPFIFTITAYQLIYLDSCDEPLTWLVALFRLAQM